MKNGAAPFLHTLPHKPNPPCDLCNADLHLVRFLGTAEMIGVLLAGGRAQRLGGGDKGRHVIGDASILDHVVRRLRAQCDAVILNANGDPGRFAGMGLPVLADTLATKPGPLAGVLAGLDYAAETYPHVRFIVTVPTDAPFLPEDLVARLADVQLLDDALVVCARSQQRMHSLTALWSVSLRDDLRQVLHDSTSSKVSSFVARHAYACADWPTVPYDPFFNVNTHEELEEAREIYARSIRPARG